MEKKAKYALITLAVLLTLAGGTGAIFIFLWGKSSSEAKQLKEDKKAYLQIKHEQDSIIEARSAHITILLDSVNNLLAEAIAVNDGTIVIKDEIETNKRKMHEETNNIISLSVSDQLKLFAKQSEEYRPR
jgi:hypothetical protein